MTEQNANLPANPHTSRTRNGKYVLSPFPEKQPRQYCEREGWIYFAHDGNAIKIGFSFSPESRIKEMQTANSREIEMLWKMRGNLLQEQELHRRFWASRIQGEWFYDDGEIRKFIESLKPQKPKPDPAPASESHTDLMRLLVWRPRIALRRTTDPMLQLAIKSYIANRKTQAEVSALKAVDVML